MAKFNPKHHTAAPSKPLPPCKRMAGETCPHQVREKSTEYATGKCSNCTKWRYYIKGMRRMKDLVTEEFDNLGVWYFGDKLTVPRAGDEN